MQLNIDVDNNQLIDLVDTSIWKRVQEDKKTIFYTYVVDQPEEKSLEVVNIYPNGGKDYKEVITNPEQGHFNVTNEDGTIFQYQIEVPDGISKDAPVPDIVNLIYWKQYTEEEIAQREQEDIKIAADAEALEEFLNNGPSRIDSIESTQEDIVLFLADMVGGAV